MTSVTNTNIAVSVNPSGSQVVATTLGATSYTGSVERFSILAEHLLVRVDRLVAHGASAR